MLPDSVDPDGEVARTALREPDRDRHHQVAWRRELPDDEMAVFDDEMAQPVFDYPTLDENRTAGPFYAADVAEARDGVSIEDGAEPLEAPQAMEFIANTTASLREDQENISPAYAATADESARVANSLHARRQQQAGRQDPLDEMLEEQEEVEHAARKRRPDPYGSDDDEIDEREKKKRRKDVAARMQRGREHSAEKLAATIAAERSAQRSERQAAAIAAASDAIAAEEHSRAHWAQVGTGEAHGGGLEQQHRQALREHEAALRALERLQQTGAGEMQEGGGVVLEPATR